MVDALRRVTRFLDRGGCILDLHPTADRATVEVAGRQTGFVDAEDAPSRHAAADAAVAAIVSDGLLSPAHAERFDFYTYGDTVDELREYIEETWRSARLADETVRRTRAAVAATAGARPRVREQVRLTKLVVAGRLD